ncbi:hypothetical protein BaRGS_00031429, partial [Batillaria attramentaria]
VCCWVTVATWFEIGCLLQLSTQPLLQKDPTIFIKALLAQQWKEPLVSLNGDGTVAGDFVWSQQERAELSGCVMLHNQARFMNVEVPSDSESEDDSEEESEDSDNSDDSDDRPGNYQQL